MPYLNLDLNYFDHRKTKRLVGRLGRGADLLPIVLWNYCGKFHAESGMLTRYSASEIESIVGWWGKSGAFVAAMLDVGYLERNGKGFKVHEWLEHQGHLDAFSVRGKIAAKARWDKVKRDAISNATSIANGCNEQCSVPTVPTVQQQTMGSPNSDPDVYSSKPKKKTAERPPPDTPNYMELLEHIFVSYKAKFGTNPLFGKAEGQTIKGLLSQFGLPQLKALWDMFLARRWDWLDRSGNVSKKIPHTVLVFQERFPDLLEDPSWKVNALKYEKIGPEKGAVDALAAKLASGKKL